MLDTPPAVNHDPQRSSLPDPYQTPGSVTAPRSARARGAAHPDFETWVASAYALLRTGKDQLGVINQLRACGLSFEEAKAESYPVFDQAKRRLRRGQLPLRIVAWALIGLGVLGPLALLLGGAGVIVVSALPVIGGVGLLYRLPNPARLPEA